MQTNVQAETSLIVCPYEENGCPCKGKDLSKKRQIYRRIVGYFPKPGGPRGDDGVEFSLKDPNNPRKFLSPYHDVTLLRKQIQNPKLVSKIDHFLRIHGHKCPKGKAIRLSNDGKNVHIIDNLLYSEPKPFEGSSFDHIPFGRFSDAEGNLSIDDEGNHLLYYPPQLMVGK
jgi:hypothetical protein